MKQAFIFIFSFGIVFSYSALSQNLKSYSGDFGSTFEQGQANVLAP